MDSKKIFRVHIDTEFTDLVNRDLVSLGMVAQNEQEFYSENVEHIKAWTSDWVKENIYPMLDYGRFGKSRLDLSISAWEWINDLPCDSVIITYDHIVDWELICDLFRGDKHPKILSHENLFNNMYYDIDELIRNVGGTGNDYDRNVEKARSTFSAKVAEYLQCNNLIKHHALADAKANKFAYDFIVNKFGIRF